MPALLSQLLNDPAVKVALTRGVMILLAYFLHSGTIPTGVDGGGDQAAAAMAIAAVSLPAGQKNAA